MTVQHQDLVVGLHHPSLCTSTSRNRFVLWVIAYLSDENGRCSVGYAKIGLVTGMQAAVVSNAVSELAEDQLVDVIRQGSRATVLQLNLERLTQLQEARYHEATDSIQLLAAYGVSQRVICALDRGGVDTVGQLLLHVDAYRELPAGLQTGLHSHLDVRNLGREGGRQIMAAVERIRARKGRRATPPPEP